MQGKREWRMQLRARRRALSATRQRINARQLANHLLQLFSQSDAQHIAAYWPNDGEIDPRIFIEQAMQSGMQIYLPIVAADGQMYFVEYKAEAFLKKNLFGIPEPAWRKSVLKHAWQMDVILLPLVGFDRAGNRLGMGAGFYDRALSTIGKKIKKPQCWGLAHACQKVDSLPSDVWDMPLHGVVTERSTHRFKMHRLNVQRFISR
jgi:5-formyltetrahydrofolate cyclo-ligase